jgi:choline-sulfatase
VSLLDLAPTLLELAAPDRAKELAADMDGSSLVPMLDGTDLGRSAAVLGEYVAEGVTSPAVMIRRGAHKFISCDGDPDQLYDLENDPHELVNLAEQSTHADLHSTFRDEVGARWDKRELERRVLESQRERHLVAEALGAGQETSWDFQPYVDASTQYVRSSAGVYELQRRARLDARGD